MECPNCKVDLHIEYVSVWDERGNLYMPHLMCGICSFGLPVDLTEED